VRRGVGRLLLAALVAVWFAFLISKGVPRDCPAALPAALAC
jgi:hypothetical protein